MSEVTQSETKPAKRAKRDQRLTLAQKLLVASYLANPNLTREDISAATGVSCRSIDRVRQEIKRELTKHDTENLLSLHYQTLAERALPITERVRILAKIARKKRENAANRLNVIRYIDRMEGLERIPAYRGWIAEAGEPVQPRPLFVLPEGTRIQLTLSPVTGEKSTPDASVQKCDKDQAIDAVIDVRAIEPNSIRTIDPCDTEQGNDHEVDE